ncbi:MAG: DUF3842 family protein [Candidatus Hydrogenedentota bacterium]|nr:MAG: DUF3842 family protein [Candidatus Hydrogenedentota bacterium]
MIVGVVDGQGGGIGAHVVERLRRVLPENTEIVALGTNAIATANMMRAGANKGASGENAMRQTAPRLDVIAGGLAIIQPHSMLGEMTPAMVEAIVRSPGRKVIMPLKSPDIEVVGLREEPIPHLIEELTQRVAAIIKEAEDV